MFKRRSNEPVKHFWVEHVRIYTVGGLEKALERGWNAGLYRSDILFSSPYGYDIVWYLAKGYTGATPYEN